MIVKYEGGVNMVPYHEVDINKEKTIGDSVSDKNTRLTNKGKVKNTPNNSHLNQIKKGFPLCDIKDIKKMTNYFREQISINNRELGYRNLLMFILGINSGLKMSQILALKWENILDISGEYHIIATDKQIEVKTILNQNCKYIIDEYKKEAKSSLDDNSYIFKTKQSNLYFEILENKNNLHYIHKLSSRVGHRAFIQALENFKDLNDKIII